MIIYSGLLLFFVFEYVRPTMYFPFLSVFHLNTIIPVLVFLGSLFTGERNNSEVFRSGNAKWFVFFLLLIGLSILTADVTFYAYTTIKDAFGYILIFFVIAKQLRNLRQMEGVFAILVLVHIVVVALSPGVVLNPEARTFTSQGVFLGDGNDFALSVCITIPFAVFLALEAKNSRMKVFWLISTLLLIFCVIGTQSRGGSIALAAILLYLWLKSRRKLVGVIVLCVTIVAVLMYAPPVYFERMETIKDYETEGSMQGRIMAWKSAIRMALDHPILGVGAGHFPVKYGIEYRPPGYGRTDLPWSKPHSIYFHVLGELGFPGLIFLLGILLSNLIGNEKRLREMRNKDDEHMVRLQRLFSCLNAGLLAFAVGGAFLTAIFYPHIYVLCGLMSAGRFIYEKDMKRLSQELDNLERTEIADVSPSGLRRGHAGE